MFVDEYPPLNAAIKEIMDHYDFDRIREVMLATDWTWCIVENNEYYYAVPTVKKIKECARELLECVAKDIQNGMSSSFHSTGGFEAEYHSYDILTLKFVVMDYGSDLPKGYSKKSKDEK